MIVHDIEDRELHEPTFVFRDADYIYVVSNENYDEFSCTDSDNARWSLAELIIRRFDTRVVKSKFA